jgi:hypothetical protein
MSKHGKNSSTRKQDSLSFQELQDAKNLIPFAKKTHQPFTKKVFKAIKKWWRS